MKATLEAWGRRAIFSTKAPRRKLTIPTSWPRPWPTPAWFSGGQSGSDGPFKEDAELPTDLPGDGSRRSRKTRNKPKQRLGSATIKPGGKRRWLSRERAGRPSEGRASTRKGA